MEGFPPAHLKILRKKLATISLRRRGGLASALDKELRRQSALCGPHHLIRGRDRRSCVGTKNVSKIRKRLTGKAAAHHLPLGNSEFCYSQWLLGAGSNFNSQWVCQVIPSPYNTKNVHVWVGDVVLTVSR